MVRGSIEKQFELNTITRETTKHGLMTAGIRGEKVAVNDLDVK